MKILIVLLVIAAGAATYIVDANSKKQAFTLAAEFARHESERSTQNADLRKIYIDGAEKLFNSLSESAESMRKLDRASDHAALADLKYEATMIDLRLELAASIQKAKDKYP